MQPNRLRLLGWLILLGMLLSACGASPTAPAIGALPSLDSVQAALDAGNYTQAATLAGQLVAADEDNAAAHFLLGLAHFNLGNFPQAQTAFETALALDPTRAAAVHHNLGALAYQQGDLDTAVSEFQQALAADPNDPDTHYQLGAAYLVMAIPQDPFAPPDDTLLAQAAAEFEAALALAPDSVAPRIGLGNLYLIQNDFAQAIAVLESVIADNPNQLEALFALGQAYAARGDFAAAQETLEHFLSLNPPAVWAEQAHLLLAELEP